MLNGNAQSFLSLPRITILPSVTHLTSSSIVIQIIPTQRTDSESAKARSIIILRGWEREIWDFHGSLGEEDLFSLNFPLSSWPVLEGVEMGFMKGRWGWGGRVKKGHLEMLSVPLSWVRNLDLSSLGEAAHLDSFAPATVVYAHLISKDWFLKIKPANTSPRRKTWHTLSALKGASLK